MGCGDGNEVYVHEAQRNTSERPDEGDELVEVVGTEPRERHASRDGEGAEDVLLPFDLRRFKTRGRGISVRTE